MANTLYPSARSAFGRAEIDWEDTGRDYTVYLLSSAYTYSAAHDFANDLTGILGTPQVLTGRTVLNDGIFDANDLNYPDVGLGETVTRVVIAEDTGTPATSPLLYYADTNNDTTPINRVGDGSTIPLVWSSATNRIFKL